MQKHMSTAPLRTQLDNRYTMMNIEQFYQIPPLYLLWPSGSIYLLQFNNPKKI